MSTERRTFALLPGLGGLLKGEFHRWLGRRILLHSVVWTLLVTGLLWLVTTTMANIEWRGFDLLIHIWWIALPLGSIAIAQNALIEERQAETLPWVLSKPVSRPAIILSKVISDALGIILPAVILQAIIAWFMLPALEPKAGLPIQEPEFSRYLTVVAVQVVIVVLFVGVAVFAGTIFRNRGPVAALGLGIWMLLWISPGDVFDRLTLGGVVSGELTGESFKPITKYLLFDQALDSASGIYWTLLWSALFTLAAIGVFSREQF
ncbi:MAG: ABC transporter permease subunit [Acidimicrobiales bacterium]|nr:ABC transporter permease subunit [Acidimicrobiales bacterium]